MLIKTRYFGNIDIDESKTICFPKGIVGFAELQRFALIHDSEQNPVGIRWLQSLDHPDFAMPVIDPLIVSEEYAPVLRDMEQDVIGECTDPFVLVSLTIPADISKMSANLSGAFVINPENNKAVQVVQENYPVKFMVYDILKAKKEHYDKVWKEHDMSAKEAWEIYYKKGIRPDDSEEYKQKYTQALHRIRKAAKEGYALVQFDQMVKDIRSLELAAADKEAVIQIVEKACE